MIRFTVVIWLAAALSLNMAGGAAAQGAFPFFANLEDEAATLAAWTLPEGSPWTLTTTAAQSGNRAFAIVPDAEWRYVTLAVPIDLAPAPNPFLSMWLRTLDGTVSYRVEISSDNGTSWTRLADTRRNGDQWVRLQRNLNAYTTQEVLLRIGASQWTAGATFMFDDLRIDNAPQPTVIRLLDPSNNGFTIEWEESSAADFRHYIVVLDTDGNGVDDRDAAGFVNGRRERRRFVIEDKGTTRLVLDDVVFTNTRYFAKIYEEDTQDFRNQGSERAETRTTFFVEPQAGPFVQDFEGDDFVWAADRPWTVTEGAAAEPGHSPTRAWEDSPLGTDESNYANDANRWLIGLVDLSQVARPVLRFSHRYNFQAGADFGTLEWSRTAANNSWAAIGQYTGAQGQWTREEIDLSGLSRQAQVYLRFRTNSNNSVRSDGWHLDDLEIADQASTTPFPFTQDVEDEAQARAEWLGSAWQVSTVAARSGNRAWSITPNGVWQYLVLAPTIDLAAEPNPYVSLWLRTVGGTVSYRLDVSSDGGATWTRLADTRTGSGEWVRIQRALQNFRSQDVRLRIGALQWTAGATILVDDILVDNAPVPGAIRLVDPGNNAMTLDWDISTADDFRRYRVVLDTDANGVNDFSTQGTVSGRRERRLFEITDKEATQLRLEDMVLVGSRYFAKVFEQDEQLFWNQGSARAETQTLFLIEPEVAPFVQDFEADDFVWAADWPWSVTEGAAAEPGHSGTRAWEDSPLGVQANYAANANRQLVVQLDLSQVARPVLRFNHRYNFQARDLGRVEWSGNLNNWTEFMQFSGVEGQWRQEEFNLSFFGRRDPIYLRFRVTSDGSGQSDGWHLDDVEIAENDRRAPFPFFDDMENDLVTEANWLGSGWELAITQARSGARAWAVRPGGLWTWKTLAPSIDLSRVAEPNLSLWLRTTDGTVSFRIEVSGDGGANWTRLADTRTNVTEWTELNFPLANFRGTETMFRIGALQWTAGATLMFDDVLIEFPPTIFGDASGDKEVTAFDAALILQHAVGLRDLSLNPNALAAADVSGNGRITAFDAALVLQFVAGLIEVFPAEEDLVAKTPAVAAELRWGKPEGAASGAVHLPLVLAGEARGAVAARVEVPLPEGVQVEGVMPRLPEGWRLVERFEDGVLRLALAGSGPLAAGPVARLQLRLEDGAGLVAGEAAFNEEAATPLAAADLAAVPREFVLAQNFPNPFNPSTQIRYSLPTAAAVELSVFNAVGQKVRTLVRAVQAAGPHAVAWDGRDADGRRVESGLYLYRLETDGWAQTRKMMLVK